MRCPIYKGAGKGGPEPLGGRQSILIDYPPLFSLIIYER